MGFAIKVGSKTIFPSKFYDGKNQNCPFTFYAPRKSLLRGIKSNIFDDLLIGNFAKVIIPENRRINFRNILKVPSKYIDNAGINNIKELREFLWIYRNSYDNKLIQIKSEIKIRIRDLIISKFVGRNNLLVNLKKIYQKL